MKKLSIFLGWRYLLGTRAENSVSTMIIICFLSILIGSFSLALVASIMNGFEQATHKKMQGIHSQILINANGQVLDPEKIASVLQKEFPEVIGFSPRAEGHAIIQHQDGDDSHSVAIIRAIDPQTEPSVSNFETKLENDKKLLDLLDQNKILIGKTIAENTSVQNGQPLTLFIAQESSIQGRKIKFENHHAIVSGIYKTGIEEFDANVVFCSLNFFEKLFPDSGPTEIGIKLVSNAHEATVIKKLRSRLNLNVHSWKDFYPALVSALKLEKYAMFFIIALITLVASMNIISLMFMQISRKRSDIAILKTIGMSDKKISRIFLSTGMLVSLSASLVGLLAAFGTGLLLEHYPFISLPDAYYVSHLPSRMTPTIFLTVFAVVFCLSFFSTLLAVRRTKKINISQVLRFEG